MVFVPTPLVADEMSGMLSYHTPKRSDRPASSGRDNPPFGGGWAKMVHEFRNHLTMVLAGTTELRATLPPALASQYADTFQDMESSVQFLDVLLTWMDASVASGPQTIAEVGDLLRRAHGLAAPGLRPRVSFSIEPRPAGVRNRGAAVECALAALITELGRVPDPRRLSDGDVPPLSWEVRASVRSERGAVAIMLTSTAGQPAPGGWRVMLAEALLASVGARVETPLRSSGSAGFVVRFRST